MIVKCLALNDSSCNFAAGCLSRLEADSGLVFRAQQCPPLRRQRSLPSMHQAAPAPQSQTLVNEQAIQKISALETELAKLRVQIAQIVQAQEQNVQSGGKRTQLNTLKIFTHVYA